MLLILLWEVALHSIVKVFILNITESLIKYLLISILKNYQVNIKERRPKGITFKEVILRVTRVN